MRTDTLMRKYLNLTESNSFMFDDIEDQTEPVVENDYKERMDSLVESLKIAIFKLEGYREPIQTLTESQVNWGNGVEEGMAKAAQILREILSNYEKE